MLKLNASYSKKVPAESNYSSRSYHASIEVELSDGMSQEQLKDKIHNTFALVREAVETEIQQKRTPVNQQRQAPRPQGNPRRQTNDVASPRQLQYLQDLAQSNGVDLNAELRRLNLSNLEDLSRQQCSTLIDMVRQPKAA